MPHSYDASLVTLSVLIGMLASYAALSLAGQVTSAVGRARVIWLTGGATVMGLGIWSMHFVGMLAFRLPVAIGYTIPLLVMSVLVAIAASLLALMVVSQAEMSLRTLLGAGLLMGFAICGMHYIGMASMKGDVTMSYGMPLVAASIVIAVTASIAALWLAFRFRAEASVREAAYKALAAVVMGVAIAGMHYTGMAAARFAPGTMSMGAGAHVIATTGLGQAIALGAFLMILLTIVGTIVDRRILQERLAFSIRLAEQAELLKQQTEELTTQAEELESQAIELELQNDELRTTNELLAEQTEATTHALHESERAEAVARAADRARVKFVNMASHELRTPIGAIGGYVELLRMGLRGPLNDAQLSDLARIDVNQRHLLRLINDMLDLAKLEAGQMQVHLAECRLCDILEAARPMVEPQLMAKHITFSREVDPSSPLVMGDSERVQQILINLLANSIKFTPPSGTIRVSSHTANGDVEVRVSDSGPGIPLHKRKSLFTPFEQLGVSTEVHGGTGLGLAISRELARAMGGDLSLAPEEMGKGATFVLSLPAALGSATSAPA